MPPPPLIAAVLDAHHFRCCACGYQALKEEFPVVDLAVDCKSLSGASAASSLANCDATSGRLKT